VSDEVKIRSSEDPLPYVPGFDVEVESDGSWTLYRGAHALARGRHRLAAIRAWAIRRELRRWRGFPFGDEVTKP
jgi:hypothetical protein